MAGRPESLESQVNEPLVCAVMLTRDRPQLAARAVRSFREQDYENKLLLCLDTGSPSDAHAFLSNHNPSGERLLYNPSNKARSMNVGQLRNAACGFGVNLNMCPEVYIHWDDDDVSAPNRISHQVEQLIANPEYEAVGWNSLPWWDSINQQAWMYRGGPHLNHALGTSLCYWRKTWERRPFTDPAGEWRDGVKQLVAEMPEQSPPLILAEQHGGNGYCKIKPEDEEWTRHPEWDESFKRIMQR